MKRFMIIAAGLSVALTASGENKPSQLKDLKDKVSYSIGLDLGFNFKKQNLELNPDALLAGVKDAQSGKQPLLSESEVKDTMTALTKELEEKQKAVAEKNVKDGEKFLAENKKKEGVKTTASGLQYKVMKEGTGPQPKLTDSVVANYRGTLINGTEFDSSYKRGQPATFPLTGVIKGWTEALQLMKVGSKYQVFVPSSLAYGERSVSPELGPNATLIFEVELLDAKPPPTPAPQGSPGTAPQAPPRPSPATSPSPK
jgi:FKBP-type peptidyl-prolyl cis-trans isomerase FklB